MINVMSPKGGVGKTTVSTNIAVGLAQREPGSTVIVDLDVQFGDVASALDLEPTHFIGDVVHGAARYDAMVLKTFLTQHKTGLYVICAPNSPAEADAITPEDVTHLLEMLTAEFRYVVLDTAPGMSDTTLAALDATTDLVLLTSMDVPGVRGMRKELDTLATLGVQTGDAADRAELRRPEGAAVPGRRGGHPQDPGEPDAAAQQAHGQLDQPGHPAAGERPAGPDEQAPHQAGGAAGRRSRRPAAIATQTRQPLVAS